VTASVRPAIKGYEPGTDDGWIELPLLVDAL
jgi:hypothetical protein